MLACTDDDTGDHFVLWLSGACANKGSSSKVWISDDFIIHMIFQVVD